MQEVGGVAWLIRYPQSGAEQVRVPDSAVQEMRLG